MLFRSLISFYRSDNGEKLLIPVELQEKAQRFETALTVEQIRSQELQAELQASQIQTESLQAQIDRYRDRFGEL